ncbi:3,4-dihydroxy-2-butanone 4-phosphate synthase [Lachancea thermotolerans]|uniref:3,4-dihydroxy-2-butanone 4-phosphate synthase n=1 Tax=Lachancea thermotolerans (strain ATCC 56472 / CBS 6340 / NRRL Y-8284) TaxID=559295 RepID=C5DEJ3_LACTC|nr:KLTH0C09746p [Lachancea thermotolerans CBS 6340]CAR22204.1 KLTH0C09746p [Lachancea thermotolerans CBS 6340]
MSNNFTPFEEALELFKQNKFVMVMDDEGRENEADLICAAEGVTQEQMAFLVRYSSGYVCAPLTNEIADRIDLPLMRSMDVKSSQDDRHGTAYTITCDFADGTTTGISAHDRALTCRKLADASTKPADFLKPGHIVPLRAVDGGVLQRGGHTEAAVDLCKLAGKAPVGVICELVRDEDGLMMRRDDCFKMKQKFDIPLITIEQLKEYISKHNS